GGPRTAPTSQPTPPHTGMRNREAFPSHFISQGRKEMRKGSALDSWLLTTTVLRGGGEGTGPTTPKRQKGFSLAATTPTSRNVRPAPPPRDSHRRPTKLHTRRNA